LIMCQNYVDNVEIIVMILPNVKHIQIILNLSLDERRNVNIL